MVSINATATETNIVSTEVANAILKSIFGRTEGFAVAASKNISGAIIVNIDSSLLSFDCVHKHVNSIPRGVSIKSVATGIQFCGNFDKIQKIIQICKK